MSGFETCRSLNRLRLKPTRFSEAPIFGSLIICDFNNNIDNDNSWLTSIPYKEFRLKAPRIILRYIYPVLLSKYIDSNNLDKIICCDEYCVHIASMAAKMCKRRLTVISWLHFSITRLNQERQRWLKEADYHLAICTQISNQICDLGVDFDKVYLLHNCVERVNYLIEENNAVNKFLYVGRVTFLGQKRVSDIFNALSKIKYPWELHIVGDGARSDVEKLKLLSINLGIQNNIIWHGWKKSPWEYIRSKIKTVSALVAASEYEGFPMTLLEALSRGIPCIYSDCLTGPRDAIVQGQNGYLFKPSNISDFTHFIEKFISNGVALCRLEIQNSAASFYVEEYHNAAKKIIIDGCK